MLFRPSATDLRIIGSYTGRAVYAIGVLLLVPLCLALAAGEPNEAAAFAIAAGLGCSVGALSQIAFRTSAPLTGRQGLATVALAWVVVPFFCAVPLLLSGHYVHFFDAYFESMSGLATVGLTVVNDVDHLARSMNLWRHLLHLIGGQAIVLAVLTVLTSTGIAATLYTGTGDKQRILPNVAHTAAFIARVNVTYAAVGISALLGSLVLAGFPPVTGAYHAVLLFLTAFNTGGFTPQSTSAAFYRMPSTESLLMVLMVAGAFSYALHHQLWLRRKRELFLNLETRTAGLALLGLFVVVALGLGRSGTFTSAWPLWRHGFFQTLSAQTTGGLSTVPGSYFVNDWGVLAPAMLVVGMAIGGMAASTAGGVKLVRIGLLMKSLTRDIRRILLPEDAVVVQPFHSTRRRNLTLDQVRGAMTLLLLFLFLYLGGGMAGLLLGYDLDLALFESTAAAATGGLSVGVVRPALEWPLKLLYLAQMWLGRLELIAVFALAGYLVSMFRGRV